MSALARLLEERVAAIEARGERRALVAAMPLADGRISRGGAALIDFASNDYLGLAGHPLLRERAAEWALAHGAGAGASRLVTGTRDLHLALEARIAAFKQTQAALIFASGWQANAAALAAILKAAPGALLFADRLIHASLHHGIAAAGARQIRFRHNDLDHLEELLERHAGAPGPRIIVTESVFGMDGDVVDLACLKALARAHDAFVYLDEAHATGVIGPGGAGLSAAAGGVDFAMGTFSKAFGGFGAYVAGSATLIDYLANVAGGFVFTTAPPPAMLGAIDAALDLVPAMEPQRARLANTADRLRARLREAGFDTGASTTHIVPVIVGGSAETVALGRRLADAGLAVGAIRPPTVARGSARLRIALHADHGEAEIERLLAALSPARAPCPA